MICPENYVASAPKYRNNTTVTRIVSVMIGSLLITAIGWEPRLDAATIWSVNTPRKQVAFTFDDGPKPETSLPLLAALEKLQIRATFFVVGREAEANIDLLKRIHDQGHEIANHTFTHRRLPTLSDAEVISELKKTNDIIQRITGTAPTLFRPPGGQFNTKIVTTAESLGLAVILWDVNAGDFVMESDRVTVSDESRNANGASFEKTVVERITSKTKSGSIVLMHNGGSIVPMLPKIVSILRTQGYEIVTVGDLLKNGKVNHNAQWNDSYATD